MKFCDISKIKDCDAVILAVAHTQFADLTMEQVASMFKAQENNKKVLADIKGLLDRRAYEDAGYSYWRL